MNSAVVPPSPMPSLESTKVKTKDVEQMHTFQQHHINKCLVFTIGNKFIYGGVAGEHAPRFVVPSENLLNISSASEMSFKAINIFDRMFMDSLQVKPKNWSILIVHKLMLEKNKQDVLLTVLLDVFQVRNNSN